jgi:hypothetical protein
MLVLNRSAIVVKAKEPFLDWLHAVDPSSRDLASSNWFGNRSSTSSRNAIRTTTWPMFCTNCVRRFSKSNWRGGTRINQLGREIGVSMSFATGLNTNTIPCWWISAKTRGQQSEEGLLRYVELERPGRSIGRVCACDGYGPGGSTQRPIGAARRNVDDG